MPANPKAAIAIAVPVVLVLIGFISWVSWYNSSDQKLQRCVKAEGQQWESKVQSDPQAQMIHAAGGDPPMTLANSTARTSWASATNRYTQNQTIVRSHLRHALMVVSTSGFLAACAPYAGNLLIEPPEEDPRCRSSTHLFNQPLGSLPRFAGTESRCIECVPISIKLDPAATQLSWRNASSEVMSSTATFLLSSSRCFSQTRSRMATLKV